MRVQAGDIISSIDGASVLKLTPMAVSVVLFERPIGGTVHLGLSRGDRAIAADVAVVA